MFTEGSDQVSPVEISPESAFESFGTTATPLPTDPVQESGADENQVAQPAEATEATPPTEAAPTEEQPAQPAQPAPAPTDDPELSAAENAAVAAASEAERPAVLEKIKGGSFMANYKSARPIAEVTDHLQKQSAARFSELTADVMARQLANPKEFIDQQIQHNPEGFTRFIEGVIEGDDKWVVKALTGQESSKEELSAALDFYNRYKDKAGEFSDVKEFTDDQLERMELVLDPDVFEAVKKNAELAKQAQANPAKGEAKEADKTPQEAQTPQAEISLFTPEQSEVFDAGYNSIRSYTDQKLDTQYKLKVTDEEWQSAPEMALLKTLKRTLLYEGDGDGLTDFTTGLVEWAKDKTDFQENRKALIHFSRAKEQENALAAAGRLRTHADKFMDERIQMPLFKMLDRVMEIVAANHQAPQPLETPRIPGAPSSGTSGAQSPEEAFDSFRF